MIRLNYDFYAKTPIHTGSDVDMGTLKSLRRQKLSIEPHEFESAYKDDERREAIVDILSAIHKCLDFSGMSKTRIMGMWDEWLSKLLRSATHSNRYQFFERLCASWDVGAVYDDILDILDSMTDDELLDTVREEARYLVLKLRKHAKDGKSEPTLFAKQEAKKEKYVKTSTMIPCISGNSIRGILRRNVMYDFVRRVEITRLSKDSYHQLFTGGVLTDSTLYEDIEKREKLVSMCPMIAVFGSAIGNMTIEGLLSVGIAYPKCHEIGNDTRSFWEYLDVVFQTRLDSSKTEKEIEIEGKHENPDQMKYEYEVFSPGTPFAHSFRFLDRFELATSAFWQMINLFHENPVVCGLSAVGNGELDLSELADSEGKERVYLDYLEANKQAIKEFFEDIK